ncbi:MAG: deoxyribodipyrimidine photo-lyase [Microcoleus sp. SIO2G3]|nr:deoxyribodipyrimidine photo-lyase [Microcoleus sp. SIO2G3]
MEKPILWVHGDCLSPKNPVLQTYPDAPAIWVWDEKLLEEWQISLKRIVFIYECLLELPVTIRRGDVAAEVVAFAKEHGADGVATVDSPSPRFETICDDIEAASAIEVEVCSPEPFVKYDGYIDLKRFSRYWRVAQQYVFESK